MQRAVEITNPDGGKEVYASYNSAPGVAGSYAATNGLPDTSSWFTNSFENSNLHLRNTFYWGPRQCASLSTTNITSFTTNDFRLARMKHWLRSASTLVGNTLSMERGPSPDAAGAIEGQITWYDYAGKTNSAYEGTQVSPLFMAQVLPDGSTRFTRSERNSLGAVTNEISTYSVTAGGTVLMRTNRYTYAANGIDLVTVTNAIGVQVSSNAYNAFHRVTTNYNALNERTTYTFNANQQPTSITLPTGLVTTNIYGADGFVAQSIVTGIATNSATYSNNLVLTLTDARGLTTTNTYDALQRLTRMSFPDGTFITNTWDKLDRTDRNLLSGRSAVHQRLVAPGEQMAEQFVPSVEAAGVSAQQPFHPGDQVRLRRLDHQMKMIRHEDVGVNLPARLGANLAQRLDEALTIHVIHEDQLAPVAAIHAVINRAGILDSQLARHAGRVPSGPLYVNIKN